jgi:hypothetical protein
MRSSVKNVSYALILLAPLAILLVMYFSWRSESRFNLEEYQFGDSQKLRFSVDKCNVNGGILHASGWAFIDGPPDKQRLQITIRRNGSEYVPKLMNGNRADVSEVFKRGPKPDHSGFDFSAMTGDRGEHGFTINIISNGVLYRENYRCQ